MAHGQFVVSDSNPNDVMGGGGCICDPEKQVDCQPPFACFYGNEMDSLASPHVVVCRACYLALGKAFEGEILSAGESSYVEPKSEPVEITLPDSQVEDLGDLII